MLEAPMPACSTSGPRTSVALHLLETVRPRTLHLHILLRLAFEIRAHSSVALVEIHVSSDNFIPTAFKLSLYLVRLLEITWVVRLVEHVVVRILLTILVNILNRDISPTLNRVVVAVHFAIENLDAALPDILTPILSKSHRVARDDKSLVNVFDVVVCDADVLVELAIFDPHLDC